MQIQSIPEVKDQIMNLMSTFQNPNFDLQRWNDAITVVATGSGATQPLAWHGGAYNMQFAAPIAGFSVFFAYEDGTNESLLLTGAGPDNNLVGVYVSQAPNNYIVWAKKPLTHIFTHVTPSSITTNPVGYYGYPLLQYPKLYYGQILGAPTSSPNTYSTRFYDHNMTLVNTYQSINEPHLFHTVTAASLLQVQFNGYLVITHNQIRNPYTVPFIGAV